MKNPCSIASVILMAATLSACGTPSARDFGGRWRPANRFDDKVVEIPLDLPYTYYVAPMDGTLKTLVARWARDTGKTLSYRLRSDFSLIRGASSLRTTEAAEAMARLTSLYAAQGIVVRDEGADLIVDVESPAPAQDASASGTAR